MATYSFPSVAPSSLVWQLVSNAASYPSAFTGAIQTLDRGGERWSATLTFTNLKGDDRAEMDGFISRLNGQQHRFTLQNYAAPQRGTLNGTPLVNGAAQTGSSIDIDGATPSQTNWIRAGDFFSVNGELKQCVLDADSDGGGNVTIEFRPRLRVSPSDNAPVTIFQPTGTFLLANDGVAISSRPGVFSSLQIECVEDIT